MEDLIKQLDGLDHQLQVVNEYIDMLREQYIQLFVCVLWAELLLEFIQTKDREQGQCSVTLQ